MASISRLAFKFLLLNAWANGMSPFPGNMLADGGTKDEHRAEMSIKESLERQIELATTVGQN